MNKILLLSNNENAKGLFTWLQNKGYKVILWSEKISVDFLKENEPTDFPLWDGIVGMLSEVIIMKN